jgi:hypothetical protein
MQTSGTSAPASSCKINHQSVPSAAAITHHKSSSPRR